MHKLDISIFVLDIFSFKSSICAYFFRFKGIESFFCIFTDSFEFNDYSIESENEIDSLEATFK